MNPTPRNQPRKFKPYLYPIESRLMLNKPNSLPKKDFIDTIFSRSSQRDFTAISIEELSSLLYISTKTKTIEIDETGFINSKRTTPSAGARHPIDLLVSTGSLSSERELSYYNPVNHSLGKLSIDTRILSEFFKEISNNLSIENACIIWFAIQAEKTASKYMNSDTLYWKDTGALLYCLQLVAQCLKLKSCPLGTLATNSFSKLFDTSGIISGGGLLIGK